MKRKPLTNSALSVNPELKAELPPLSSDRLAYLTIGINRDGVLDPVKFWVNPETQLNEIIDGHHRHQIAQELGLSYNVQEVEFPSGSITAVKYWMHVNQSGRRGSETNTKRMVELKQQLVAEAGQSITKTEAVKVVAKDAKKSERQVWRKEQPDKPKREPKIVTPEEQSLSALKVIGQLIAKLTDEHKQLVKQMFDTAEPDPKGST